MQDGESTHLKLEYGVSFTGMYGVLVASPQLLVTDFLHVISCGKTDVAIMCAFRTSARATLARIPRTNGKLRAWEIWVLQIHEQYIAMEGIPGVSKGSLRYRIVTSPGPNIILSADIWFATKEGGESSFRDALAARRIRLTSFVTN